MGTHVLTGSASGIGAATRARLESAGHSVIGVDLRDADIIADLSTAEGRATALEEVRGRLDGQLDGLVPCAGVSVPASAELTVAVNWFGTETFLTGLRPELAASDGIAKVVVACSNSTTISPNTPESAVDALLAMDEAEAVRLCQESFDASAISYAVSKTALARYVRRNAPRAEWAGAGIRLNAIAPGAVQTPLLQAGLDSENYGDSIRMLPVPAGDFGSPDQIARWIEFMLSDAADFMVGSIVFVDGGSDALIRPDAWPQTFTMDLN